MTITMDAKTMTITRTQGQNEVKTVYNLDGSDSKNMQTGRGGAAGVEVTSHAKWDGAKLVITTTQDMGGTAVTRTVTYSVDGKQLVQATTGPGRGDPTPVTTTVKYNKGM